MLSSLPTVMAYSATLFISRVGKHMCTPMLLIPGTSMRWMRSFILVALLYNKHLCLWSLNVGLSGSCQTRFAPLLHSRNTYRRFTCSPMPVRWICSGIMHSYVSSAVCLGMFYLSPKSSSSNLLHRQSPNPFMQSAMNGPL